MNLYWDGLSHWFCHIIHQEKREIDQQTILGVDAGKYSAYDSSRRHGSSNDNSRNDKLTLQSRKLMDAASKVFLQKSEDKQEDSGRSTQSVPKIRVNSRSLWSFDAQKIIKNLWKTWEKDGEHAGNLWVFHPFPNFWIPGLRPRNCSTLQPAKRPSSRSSRPGAGEWPTVPGGHERWTVQDRKLGFKP